jgi:hypothetical protein
VLTFTKSGRCRVMGAAAAALTLTVGVGDAGACSCVDEPALERSIENADVIFEGRLIAVDPVQAELGVDGYTGALRYQFDVARYFKGRLGRTLPVFTIDQSSACGRDYSFAFEHLVYARYTDAGLLADSACSRSRPSPFSDEDLDVLGVGIEPNPELAEDAPSDPADDDESLSNVPIAGEAAAASCATSLAPGQPAPLPLSSIGWVGAAALLLMSRKHRRT